MPVPLSATFHACNDSDALLWLVRYFEHADFASALADGLFTSTHARRYTRGLFTALAHIHAHGYVHRDIKPHNVLYNFHRMHTLVVDFGLVQCVSADAKLHHKRARSLEGTESRFEPPLDARLPTKASPSGLVKGHGDSGEAQGLSDLVPSGTLHSEVPDEPRNAPSSRLPSSRLPSSHPPTVSSECALLSRQMRRGPVGLAGGDALRSGATSVRSTTFQKPTALDPTLDHRVVMCGKQTAAPAQQCAPQQVGRALPAAARPPQLGGRGVGGSRESAASLGLGGLVAHQGSLGLQGRHAQRRSVAPKEGDAAELTRRQPLQQLRQSGATKPSLPSLAGPREGTRGFRAPEVLLRKPVQGPAIDVWAAGVTVLSLVTKRYPVFDVETDEEALAEIFALFSALGQQTLAPCVDVLSAAETTTRMGRSALTYAPAPSHAAASSGRSSALSARPSISTATVERDDSGGSILPIIPNLMGDTDSAVHAWARLLGWDHLPSLLARPDGLLLSTAGAAISSPHPICSLLEACLRFEDAERMAASDILGLAYYAVNDCESQ